MRQIVTKHWEGTSLEAKPTGVIAGTTLRETDTNKMWITYDGTVWIVADKRVRLVEEDGTFIDLPQEFATLILALKTAMEVAIDSGEATGGSNTSIIDTGKSWETNMWQDATFEVEIAGKSYLGICVSNTQTVITIPALAGAAAVVAECWYGLKRPVEAAGIMEWGGTALTGRDISLDLKALIDDSVKGLLRSIGDAGDTPDNQTGQTALKKLHQLSDDIHAVGEPKSAHDTSTGATLTVTLDCGGWSNRQQVDVWVKSSAAATFKVQGSTDNSNWRQLQFRKYADDTLADLEVVLGGAGEGVLQFACGYRYLRVITTAENDNEIEITR